MDPLWQLVNQSQSIFLLTLLESSASMCTFTSPNSASHNLNPELHPNYGLQAIILQLLGLVFVTKLARATPKMN
jgi:hypothetical protein